MFEFMRKYKTAFFVLTLVAVAAMVLYSLSDDEALGPGENGQPQPAAVGDAAE